MYLFFDTETTGLPKDPKKPAEDGVDNYPYLLQLAYQCFDDDRNFIKQENYYICRDNFTIPKEATAIHGINEMTLLINGEALHKVLNNFVYKDMKKADRIVAHNLFFDENVVKAELIRCGLPNCFKDKWKTCTMLSSVSYCKFPKFFGGYKYPSLQELYYFLFGEYYDGEHNALYDANATAQCFFELVDRGIIPDKNRSLKSRSYQPVYQETIIEEEEENTLPEELRYCFRCEGELTEEDYNTYCQCPHCGRYLYPWEDD